MILEELMTAVLSEKGIMGLWLLSMLIKEFVSQKELKQLIKNNTEVMIKVEAKL